MKNFTYLQAAGYLDECMIFGIKPSLIRIKKIIEILGYPRQKTDFIHVVGTNGKTSTTIITAHILNGQGLRSGFHISPHITEYTERLWYCGGQITKKRFAKLLSDLFPHIREVNALDLEGPMTQFEIIAAMAFKLAWDEGLDAMVLEAGLGGRWDATNAVDSKVAGLTGVSLEHTSVLGGTIKEIAIEKSKVIKNGAVSATLSNDKDVLEVLEEQAYKTGSKLYIHGRDFSLDYKEKIFLEGWKVQVKGIYNTYKDLVVPLIGDYQPENLTLALVLSELYMHERGLVIEEQKLKKSLENIKVKGRFEILRKEPLVLADTSHNPEGIKNFVKNIRENFNERRKIIIFSVLKDKDYKIMLADIAGISDILILTSSNVKRSLSVEMLEKELQALVSGKKAELKKLPGEVYKINTISNSLNYALNISGRSDIICITGSITNLENIV